MTRRLVFNRALESAETVEVFHFDDRRLHHRTIGKLKHQIDVGLEAHVPLLHDSLGDPEKSTEIAQLLRESHHIVGAVEVGCGDYFEERRACAVEIDE